MYKMNRNDTNDSNMTNSEDKETSAKDTEKNDAKKSIEYVNTNPNVKTQVHYTGERVSLYHQLRFNKQHGLLPSQQDKLFKRRNKSGSSSYLKGTVAKYYQERKERLRKSEVEKQKQIELELKKFRMYRESGDQRKTFVQDKEHSDIKKNKKEYEGDSSETVSNSNTTATPSLSFSSKILVVKRRPKRRGAKI